MTTTDTTPNLQGAHLTGALLGLLKHGHLSDRDYAAACYALRHAHQTFPSLTSAETLAEVDALEGQRLELHLRERRRLTAAEAADRFRHEDGDHHQERAERLPEHDYPG
jgi:hypothetical protein